MAEAMSDPPPGDPVPGDPPPDPRTLLRNLRQRFPLWGFQYDGLGKWTAVRGKHPAIVTHSPDDLWNALAEIDPAGGGDTQ